MYQRAASPQPIGGVLDNAVRLFKASFTQVIGLAAVASLLESFWRLFDNTFDRLMTGTFDPAQGPGWDVVPMFVGLLAALYLHLAMTSRMHAFAADRAVTVGEALRRALVRYPAMLLCLLALFLPFAFVLVVVAAGVVLFGLVGTLGLALLMPGAVLIVYWYFAVYLVVTANIGGFRALRRSFSLVRGNFWRTVTVLTVALFVQLAVAALVGALAAALGAVAGIGGFGFDSVVFVVEVVVGAATIPFIVAVTLAMLHDLELRREGMDLAQRIEALR